MESTLAGLAVRARAGDSAGSDALLRRLIPDGLRLARAMLADEHQAEDSVQDACVKAWRKLERLREGSDPRPWFLGIVANECKSFRRSRWATGVVRMASVVSPAAGAPDGCDGAASAALRSLSKDDRLVLVLRYHMDMSVEQTAAVLHISAIAVRSRSHRAARRLRDRLVAGGPDRGR